VDGGNTHHAVLGLRFSCDREKTKMKCKHCQLNLALLSDLNAQHKALRERLRKAQDELFGELIVNEFMRRELPKRDLPALAHGTRKKGII
jgi:hypothetical protein